jgi:protein phosphatase
VSPACGLDDLLNIDLRSGDIAMGDIFAITGDGVHGVLSSAMIMSCLIADITAAQMAESLTARAVADGGKHNVSACVARVESLPRENEDDMARHLLVLPVVTPPEAGATVDGFKIETLLHKSRQYRLYKAVDEESGGTFVLKFPNPKLAERQGFADSFLREEWIGKRVHSPHLVKSIALRGGRRSALYTVMAHHVGENLAERIRRKKKLSVNEALFLFRQLLAGLRDLHKQGVLHRDIRPKNMLLDKKNKHLLLLGLGTSHVEQLTSHTGNPEQDSLVSTYLAPELFDGRHATVVSDLYSAGVTLYRMLTGKYPYGNVKSPDNPPSGEYVSAVQFSSEVPLWLDDALRRACATDPDKRFRSVDEFSQALVDRESTPDPLSPVPPTSIIARLTAVQHWELILIGVLVAGFLLYLTVTFR